MKDGASPYESSKLMMEKGIECMGKNSNASRIKQRAREISDALIQNNQYYSGAIKHISASIDAGLRIVFSTTNYCEAAEAFLNRLFAQGLLKERHQDKIICSGSIFDWERRLIAHLNMGKGKIAGLSKTLRIPVDELSNYTDSVYGDDPQGNDSGIIQLVRYLISTITAFSKPVLKRICSHQHQSKFN